MDSIDHAIQLHQSGRIPEARAACERLLAADPGRPDAKNLLGVIAHQEGRPADAIERFREAVALDPSYHPARRNLAALLASRGDAQGATAELSAIVAADPRDGDAWRRLGEIEARAGRLEAAARALEAAVQLAESPSALNNLGVVLKDLGRLGEAEAMLRRAVAAAPTSPDPLNNLGLALLGLGRLAEAEQVFRAGIAIDAGHVDLLNNLAVLLKQAGRQPEGEPLLRRALTIDPADVGVLVNLGDLLVAKGRAEEALPLLHEAVRLAPRSPEARNNLALALKEVDREEEATPHLEAAVALNPRYLPAIHNLGNNLVATGRVAEGVRRFLEVLDRDPRNMPALYALATVTDHPLDDESLAKIDGMLADPAVGAEGRQLLHMAAAVARDRRGEHDRGIGHAMEAGRLRRGLDRRAGLGFSREECRRFVDAISDTFRGDRMAGLPSSMLADDTPVFVVGMPRSGTTLVEQILASHPLVHGAGETDAIARAALAIGGGRIEAGDPAAYPHAMAGTSAAVLQAEARRVLAGYAESANRSRPADAPGTWPVRIVDKTTINFYHVGLIGRLFPRARIIHTLRDPRDTGVSCLFHNFAGGGLHFTNDLGDLGLVHRLKDRLMAHWHEVYPGMILDVPYESLVEDPEGWTRRLLDHCGLAWSDRCLAFHTLERRVKTASNLQVRKPIYGSSVARWKRYERHLGPFLDALAGGNPPEPAKPAELEAERASRPAGAVPSPLMAQGIAAHAAGRNAEAVDLLRRAVAASPADPRARVNLGVVLKGSGAIAESEQCYRQAIALAPSFVMAHNNLGILLSDAGRRDEAIACFEEALRIDPGFADARHNRGAVLAAIGRHEEAIDDFHAALAADAGQVEYHNSLGASLAVLGRTAEALACYERAITLDPDHAWAHFNRSQAWLLQGDWERGFAEWEWRSRLPAAPRRTWEKPAWDGSVLPGATLLAHCEQGLGDTLQFIRFARAAKERVGRVVVECQAALVPLLSRCGYVDTVVPKGSPLPPHDVQASLLSLPHLLRLRGESLGEGGPSLVADPDLVSRWKGAIERLPGTKIGIAWQGNPKYARDASRSVPLAAFAPLGLMPGITLVSLQKGFGRDQLTDPARRPPFPVVDLGADLDEAAGAFMDTAAIMMNLDLVITSDTAIPHLAGGLGVPVWLAVAASPDFRWLDAGDRSPWYPSMRIFRQPRPGDWGSAFSAIFAALCGGRGGP